MKEEYLHIAKQLASLAGVAAFYYCLRSYGDLHLLGTLPWLTRTFSPALLFVFERHVWQFLWSMAALTVLSRGNLWSCGINSMNIRESLTILLGFYAGAVIVISAMASVSLFVSHGFQTGHVPDKLLVMTIHWLSSPVADQLLFFGLFQTSLAKYWTARTPAGPFELPSVIFITAVAFTLGRLGLPHYTSAMAEYAAGFGVGIFSGYMYHRTRC